MVARIAGVDIPCDKHVVISLTCIYGTGDTTAKEVLTSVGVPEGARVRNLTNEQTDAICAEINKLKVEGDLRRGVSLNIEHLIEIGPYRGIHHHRGLPTRGQNTKNNAHTREGPTKTVAGKKK